MVTRVLKYLMGLTALLVLSMPPCNGQNYPYVPQTAAYSIVGNQTATPGLQASLNPLSAANLMSAVIAVDVVATSNITLSGPQTIDGIALVAGNTVLAATQTSSVNNGIYVVQAGAWTRAVNFPSGYVIPQNCDLVIYVRNGNVFSGRTFFINTASAITIGTTGFLPTTVSTTATTTRSGTVTVTGGNVASSFGGSSSTSTDCVSFNDGAGSINDLGDVNSIKGPCAVENSATGHLVLQNGGFHPTASTGTLNTNSTDHWGIVTGLAAATAVTITFATAYPNTPACSANDSASTAVGITAISGSSVTFSMTALTGTLYYTCFGTN